MSGRAHRFPLLVACLPLLVPLAGCFVVTDLVNPGVLSAIGLDPAVIIPSQGRLVIVFNNATQYAVTNMYALVADDVSAVVDGAITLGTDGVSEVSADEFAANETRMLILECPVAIVSPGGAALVIDGAVTLPTYAGSLMVSGRDYRCGDVIEIRVTQVADVGTEGAFAIQVRVLAGR